MATAIVLITGALAWLLTTASGRDFALGQLAGHLPKGTTLHWQNPQGTLAGSLTLHEVQLSFPRQRDSECRPTPIAGCAMTTVQFHARRIELDPDVWLLLAGKIHLAAISVRNATLTLPRDDTSVTWPRWPEVLPRLALPVTVHAPAIHIERLQVLREQSVLLVVREARANLSVHPGMLQVTQLQMDSDHGLVSLRGHYAPRQNFHTDLLATAQAPAHDGRPPARLTLRIQGDLGHATATLSGQAPAPVHATLVLEDGNTATPRWRLQANSSSFDPALLTASGSAGTPLSLQIAATGTGGLFRAQGRLRRNTLDLTLQPSVLQLRDRQLQVRSAVVDVQNGRIVANGNLDLRDPARTSAHLTLHARGLRWDSEDGATRILGNADLAVHGQLEDWHIDGQARLQRGRETAHLELAGNGNRDRLQLSALNASMPQGRLQGSGEILWAPQIRWTAHTMLSGFDPGYFAPDWPGSLHGRLYSSGAILADGTLLAELQVTQLRGHLRQRPLAGRASLAIHGDHSRGDLALTLGSSQLKVRADIAQTLAVEAALTPLRLDDLLPGQSGVIRGTLQLHGARQAPDIAVALDGQALALAETHIDRLHVHGQLPGTQGVGSLQLEAQNLQSGPLALHRLQTHLRGALSQLQIDAAGTGDGAALALSGHVRSQGNARWQGAVETATLTLPDAGVWTLQSPALWVWQAHRLQLTPACWQARIGGRMCLQGSWPQPGLTLRGEALPLELLASQLPARHDGMAWQLTGTVDASADIRPTDNGWHVNLRAHSTSGSLRERSSVRLPLARYRDFVLTATLDPRQWQISAYATLGASGALAAQLETGPQAQDALHGILRVRTRDLLFLELFSPDIAQPSGLLDIAVQLDGTRAQPRLGGEASLQGLAAELPALGIALHDGSLQLRTLDDGSARITGSLPTGNGALQIDGILGWQDPASPLRLSLQGERVLLADTRQLRLLASPALQLHYRAGAPLQLRGTLTVPEAALHLDRLDMGVTTSPDVVVIDPIDQQPAVATPLAQDLNLTVVLGEGVRVDGYGLTGKLSGILQLYQSPLHTMRANGALAIAGRYRAYGQDLHITRGRLLWSNSAIEDPLLDVRAEREIGDVTAGVQVSGRASSPQASVWSDPPLQPSEALAYLILGRPLPSLSSREMQQVDMARSALNAGTGLLTAQLGSRLGLDDAGVSTSRSLGSEVLGIGKYLSPRLYVSYGVSLLGTGQVAMLKYLLRRGFEIQIESSTTESRVSINWQKEK